MANIICYPLSLFFRDIKFMLSFKATIVSYATSILIVDNSISILMELIREGYKIRMTNI